MSKRNEDRDVFFIPPNFLTSGRLFGGSIRFRNAIEASILVLITAFPIIKLPLDLTPKIMLLCLLPLPLGIFGVLGVEGESLSEFVLNWLKWLTNRRTLYRTDAEDAPEGKKQRHNNKVRSSQPPAGATKGGRACPQKQA